MNKKIIIVLTLFIIALCGVGVYYYKNQEPTPEPDPITNDKGATPAGINSVVSANNQFALDLYSRLINETGSKTKCTTPCKIEGYETAIFTSIS